jgi:SAM-dependent methyltransferase
MVLIHGPFNPLPWIDEMFHKVLLVNVAYFLDSDGRDISEAYRVLRSGGRLVVYVTARETMEKWPFAGRDTHRTFDARDLALVLENGGFRRSHIMITHLELAFGIRGLIAIAEKAGPTTLDDRPAQDGIRGGDLMVVTPDLRAARQAGVVSARFGNKARSWEQASVAKDRQEPRQSRSVAGRRNAHGGPCSEYSSRKDRGRRTD